MGNSNTAALAMSAVATFPRMARLPREALRLTRRIEHRKIVQLKIALPKAVRLRRDPKKADPKKADPKKADPKKADPKKADPKKDALSKIVVLSAIAPNIPKPLTFITMTRGSATIPAAVTNTTTWIIRGNTAASLEASAAATSIVLGEETAIASGSTTGSSA